MYGTLTLPSKLVRASNPQTNQIKRNEIHQGETQVERAGQLLQWSIFTNAFVQEIPRKKS